MTLPLIRAARCVATLAAGIALAGPALAIGDWNLPGSTGVPDEASVALLPLNLPYVALSGTVQTGTHVIRYGLPGTECFACEFVYPVFGVRLLDAGAGSRVRVTLRSYDRIAGTTATLMTVDSDAFPNGPSYANREAEGRNVVFDFSRKSYWLEAELTRSVAGASLPAVAALWLRWASY
jgi:hypothetical protein